MFSVMESDPNPVTLRGSASEYRQRFGRMVMVMTELRGPAATRQELCRVAAVDTIGSGLWVTVRFLDGQTRGLRAEMIRPANEEERKLETVD